MLRLFDFGVICYEIKNGRNILVWLATWGGSLPCQLRYTVDKRCTKITLKRGFTVHEESAGN
jgi:hypothetical protein